MMKPLLILIAFLIGLPAFGQSTWRNFFTTNQNPIVEVVAGSNATVQASTVGVNLRRFTVNGTGSGSGSGQTNWPVSSITNAGTAAYSNSSAFYLNSNPSNYITAAQVPAQTNISWQSITNISSVQIPQAAITNQTPSGFGFGIDGGGAAIQAGTRAIAVSKVTGTITSCTLAAYPSGSVEVRLWRTNSSDASFPPTAVGSIGTNALTSDSYQIDSTLSGWTTLVTSGDVFTVNIPTNALSITNLTMILKVQP